MFIAVFFACLFAATTALSGAVLVRDRSQTVLALVARSRAALTRHTPRPAAFMPVEPADVLALIAFRGTTAATAPADAIEAVPVLDDPDEQPAPTVASPTERMHALAPVTPRAAIDPVPTSGRHRRPGWQDETDRLRAVVPAVTAEAARHRGRTGRVGALPLVQHS